MPNYDIELFWQCPNCTHVEHGGEKKCSNCGKFRTEKEQDIWPEDLSEANAVQDPEKIRQAHAGPDWHCAFCGSSQRRDEHTCAECGADQRQGREIHQDRKEVDVDLETGHKTGERAIHDIPAPESKVTSSDMIREDIIEQGGQVELSANEIRNMLGEPIRESIPKTRISFQEEMRRMEAEDPVLAFKKSQKDSKRNIIFGVAGAFLAVIGIILFLIFHTRTVNVEVSAVEWHRTIHVDRYQVWHREGFDPDNGAFDVHDDGRRIHHYDHVRVGSHTEHYSERVACGQDCTTPSCYTTPRSCTSNKNGFASCTGGDRICPSPVCSTRYCDEDRTRSVDDYEDQPRYQEYYDWNVWDWGHNRDVQTTGNTTVINWPTEEQVHLNLGLREGEREREAGREESWKVTFAGDGDTWSYTPKSTADFQRYPLHRKLVIRVNHLGSVEIPP